METLPDWLVAIIAAFIPALGEQNSNGFNGYVEADYVYVAPSDPGRITSISVEEGERVFEGQQVLTLESTRQRAALRAAEARAHLAEANLENLQTGSREQEIAVIRAELARAEAEQELAAGNLARTERLLDRGSIPVAQADADRAALASARASVAELQAQLKVAELPARDAQQIAAEAALDAARAEAEAARSALDDRVLLSPVTGHVDSIYFEAGEVAGAGVPVLSILPDGSLLGIFFIPEPRRAEIAIGDTLLVTCDSCEDGIFATVSRLASAPQYTPPIIFSRNERSRLVFRAEAQIEADANLLPGQPITMEPRR